MEKKEYIQPVTKLLLVHSEGVMYTTSVEQGEDWGDEESLQENNHPIYSSKQVEDTYWDEGASDF